MASSSYYSSEMTRLSGQIAKKKKRRQTCWQVHGNLSGESSYYNIAIKMQAGADCLESGVDVSCSVSGTSNDVREDKEVSPESDLRLSDALQSLQQEINSLDREIDSLQQQYAAAQRNYRAAKDREWQETLERLKDML